MISTANSMVRLSAGMERTESIAADFNRVYYEDGKGETVVLLHGVGLSKDMWWDMFRPHLSRIKAPTLVIWGEKGCVFHIYCAEIFRKGIRNSRVEIIRDAGRIPYFDRPEETVSAVRNFVVSQSTKQ